MQIIYVPVSIMVSFTVSQTFHLSYFQFFIKSFVDSESFGMNDLVESIFTQLTICFHFILTICNSSNFRFGYEGWI